MPSSRLQMLFEAPALRGLNPCSNP